MTERATDESNFKLHKALALSQMHKEALWVDAWMMKLCSLS